MTHNYIVNYFFYHFRVFMGNAWCTCDPTKQWTSFTGLPEMDSWRPCTIIKKINLKIVIFNLILLGFINPHHPLTFLTLVTMLTLPSGKEVPYFFHSKWPQKDAKEKLLLWLTFFSILVGLGKKRMEVATTPTPSWVDDGGIARFFKMRRR